MRGRGIPEQEGQGTEAGRVWSTEGDAGLLGGGVSFRLGGPAEPADGEPWPRAEVFQLVVTQRSFSAG